MSPLDAALEDFALENKNHEILGYFWAMQKKFGVILLKYVGKR